jgi:DNA repair protein RecO (recombination protein O)
VREIRLYRVSALVLRQCNLAEADRIVTLFTRERGKLSAIAKGSKRPKSKLAAGTQLFTHSRLQLAVGRNLDVVTQCEVVHPFDALHRDLTRLAYASYLCELVDCALEEQGRSERVFNLMLGTLQALETTEDPELLVRAFELRLCDLLGYRPQLDHCVSCGKPAEDGALGFSPGTGGVLCEHCAETDAGALALSPPALRLCRHLLQPGAELPARERVSGRLRGQLEVALRAYLEVRLERRLRSVRLLRELTGERTKVGGQPGDR